MLLYLPEELEIKLQEYSLKLMEYYSLTPLTDDYIIGSDWEVVEHFKPDSVEDRAFFEIAIRDDIEAKIPEVYETWRRIHSLEKETEQLKDELRQELSRYLGDFMENEYGIDPESVSEEEFTYLINQTLEGNEVLVSFLIEYYAKGYPILTLSLTDKFTTRTALQDILIPEWLDYLTEQGLADNPQYKYQFKYNEVMLPPDENTHFRGGIEVPSPKANLYDAINQLEAEITDLFKADNPTDDFLIATHLKLRGIIRTLQFAQRGLH